jgi:DNA helicase-2/ATP-dependent DNA helicase PcrA
LNQEEKISYIRDTFENNGLRQNIEKMDENIILATVHACKGLEYKYVIIADNEQNSFPTYKGVCDNCYSENKENPRCKKKFVSANEKQYYEELSVFYVAFTRAKEKVIFTMSKERLNAKGASGNTVGSCFLKLKGIGYKNFHKIENDNRENHSNI